MLTFRGVSNTPRHPPCEPRTGAPAAPLEQLGEDAARGVGQVEDDAELDEPAHELAPESREPAAVLSGAVGEQFLRFHVSPAIRTPSAWNTSAGQVSTPRHSTPSRASTNPIRSPDSTRSRSRAAADLHDAARVLAPRMVERGTIESASRSDPSGWTVTST